MPANFGACITIWTLLLIYAVICPTNMAQLMPLPLTVSCFSKIQIGFTFLVPAHPGSPGQRAVKWVRVLLKINPAESADIRISRILWWFIFFWLNWGWLPWNRNVKRLQHDTNDSRPTFIRSHCWSRHWSTSIIVHKDCPGYCAVFWRNIRWLIKC